MNERVRRILLVLTVALVIAAMMAAAAPVAFAAPAGTGLVGPCEQESTPGALRMLFVA